jgi:hypothetical protein
LLAQYPAVHKSEQQSFALLQGEPTVLHCAAGAPQTGGTPEQMRLAQSAFDVQPWPSPSGGAEQTL